MWWGPSRRSESMSVFVSVEVLVAFPINTYDSATGIKMVTDLVENAPPTLKFSLLARRDLTGFLQSVVSPAPFKSRRETVKHTDVH